MAIDFTALETLIRHDPRGRGVASCRRHGEWLASGMLERAACDLAQRAGAVAIVTGFTVADVEPPVAESDGPPGALYLARALVALGIDVTLVSDGSALSLLNIGCKSWQLNAELVEISPASKANVGSIGALLPFALADRLTHLIAIERVGPSHTLDSITTQIGNTRAAIAQFEAEVPPAHRDACHNMRGVIIDNYTAPAHRLFEVANARRAPITTIGIGDGGNEIGMGAIPWEVLRQALPGEQAGRIICRIATDFLIMAGVSNWGAYALACAVANLRGRSDLISNWDEVTQRELIELLVREGGAVDGLTRRHGATVDGLPLDQYLSVLRDIRRACAAA